MTTEILVTIGSGYGLLSDSTKSLPEPMFTDHQWSQVTFIWVQIPNELEIIYVKFHSNPPGAYELSKQSGY